MKPKKNWLTEGIKDFRLGNKILTIMIEEISHPMNIMINISESVLSPLIPTHLGPIVENARKHLRRVYPRGSRIKSGNLNPLNFWRAGSHFAALNWQKYDLGMQLNEAMFCGTGGWVVKPESQRGLHTETDCIRIAVEIRGLSARMFQSLTHIIPYLALVQFHGLKRTKNCVCNLASIFCT